LKEELTHKLSTQAL